MTVTNVLLLLFLALFGFLLWKTRSALNQKKLECEALLAQRRLCDERYTVVYDILGALDEGFAATLNTYLQSTSCDSSEGANELSLALAEEVRKMLVQRRLTRLYGLDGAVLYGGLDGEACAVLWTALALAAHYSGSEVGRALAAVRGAEDDPQRKAALDWLLRELTSAYDAFEPYVRDGQPIDTPI